MRGMEQRRHVEDAVVGRHAVAEAACLHPSGQRHLDRPGAQPLGASVLDPAAGERQRGLALVVLIQAVEEDHLERQSPDTWIATEHSQCCYQGEKAVCSLVRNNPSR